jgi:putative membrane protein
VKLTKLMPTLIFGGIATIAIGVFVPGAAPAASEPNAVNAGDTANPAVAQLLNKANAINYEEIQMADIAENKAGDNQAMLTFAKTLKGDHMANEDAVTALSRQENVKIQHTPTYMSQKLDEMKKLNGAEFNDTMVSSEVKDHEKALSFYETERAKFHNNPRVELYIDQTIPVLRAHLQLAKNLQTHMAMAANANSANNMNATR